MVSKQIIQIIIEAEEQVSKVAKKAEQALDKLGNSGEKGMNKLNNASSKTQNVMSKLSSYVDKAREKFNELRNNGQSMSSTIKQGISSAANSFGKLITSSNTAKLAMEKIKSVSDGIQSKFNSLKAKIISFGSSAKSALGSAFNITTIRAKLSNLGSSIDKLKSKLRSLAAEAKQTGGSGGLGFLRNAASMTAGMLGYDLVNSMMENTRASLNARSSIQAFASRLNMSATEVNTFQKSLDNLQSTYKKIDMDVVGQQATDMAYRLGLPKTALTELTETTAIFSDAMQRNGRSAEDSMLAMSDAMDGQFVRLKEIGITQKDLMNNGWDGDINNKTGLLKAMNKALKEQHYDDLAKSVDNLDDAWQVLSITGGNLIETILLPLTPVIVGVINAFTNAVSGIQNFIGKLQAAWNGLPEWEKIAILIGGVAVAVGIAVAAFGGLEAILLSLASAIAPAILAITSISWPLVAVVAVIGLVVAAIYEVGKAFGWWTDVSSMLSAIGAGLQRLWSAFINHPDVQAAIKGIGDALQAVGKWVTWAGQQVLAFFGVSTGGDWDVVASIINGIGAAWAAIAPYVKAAVNGVITHVQMLMAIVGFAISIGQGVYNALKPIVCILLGCSPGIVPALQQVYSAFMTVWNTIVSILAPIVSSITGLINSLISIFNRFRSGQISLPQAILMVLTLLWTYYVNACTKIVQLVLKFGRQLLTNGIRAGRNFLNGVMNYIRQLPGKVYSALIQAVSKIISAGAQWVSSARTKAQAVVDGVYNALSKIPGKIASALNGVVSAITKPFQDAYNTAKGIWDKIASLASSVPSVNSSAGYDYLEGQNSDGSRNVNAAGYEENIEVSGELTIIHDLKDVPSGIDENLLVKLLIESMKDPEVGKILAENMGFQNWDSKIKNVIAGKKNRARGV